MKHWYLMAVAPLVALTSAAQSQSTLDTTFTNTWYRTFTDDDGGTANSITYGTGLAQDPVDFAGSNVWAFFKSIKTSNSVRDKYQYGISTLSADGSFHEPLNFIMPAAGNVSGSLAQFQSDTFTFSDWTNNERMRFDALNGITTYSKSGSQFSFGLDQAGMFSFGYGGSFYVPALAFSPFNNQANFAGPIRLGSFTNGTLPGANVVGAGTIAWLGSGNTGQIVVSDGTTWAALQSAPLTANSQSAAVAQGPVASNDTTATSETGGNSSSDPYSTADQSSSGQSLAILDPVSSQLQSLQGDMRRANGGIAAAMALGGTMMPPDATFAISVNGSRFAGETGYSASVAGRISRRIWVNAGFAGSTAKRSTGGRAGFTVAW